MPASPSTLDRVSHPAEPDHNVIMEGSSGWYDPDASSWEPQPPVFEAFRASAPRPPIAMGPGRSGPGRRTAAGRPSARARRG